MSKVQTVKEPSAIVRYYRETVGELRKVVWPTPRETANLTVIVLLVVFVMALTLGGFDYVFASLFQVLVNLNF